MIDLLF